MCCPVKVGYIYERVNLDNTYPISEEYTILDVKGTRVVAQYVRQCKYHPIQIDTIITHTDFFIGETPANP